MKKNCYMIFLFSMILFIACGSSDHDAETQVEQAIYLAEEVRVFEHLDGTAFGRPFFHKEQIYIPFMTKSLMFKGEHDEERFSLSLQDIESFTEINLNGERKVVGVDIFYGEDYFSVPLFGITASHPENPSDTLLALHVFDRSVDFVQIHAVDAYNESSVRLLASLFVEEEAPALYAFELVPLLGNGTARERKIEPQLLGDEQVVTFDAWFDADGNVLLLVSDLQTQSLSLIILDPNLSTKLAHISIEDPATKLALGADGYMWSVSDTSSHSAPNTQLRKLDSINWTWTDEIILPFFGAVGLHVAPESSMFAWFVYTEETLYGVTQEGALVKYFDWIDSDVVLGWDTTVLFPQDGTIYVFDEVAHPYIENAVVLNVVLLRKADEDFIDEREVFTIGGVGLNDSLLFERVSQFNRESETHRAIIIDYADGGMWDGALMRLRTDLIRGEGPDLLMLNTQFEENDISHALKQGGFLADLHPFIENDPDFAYADFFTNIFELWTNQHGQLSYIAGSVVLQPFWGPSELLEEFTDFTHAGFLQFLRSAENEGIPYPMGLNFLPYTVFATMLFADNTFFCYTSGEANFENDLFLDILEYAASIPDNRQEMWMQAMRTGEAFDPTINMSRGEQLLTRMFGFMTVSEFHFRDFSVGGLTPIGAPNAAGDFAFSASAIRRMGIRANSPNAEAAWSFIRLFLLQPNSDSTIEGLPIRRDLFDAYINEVMLREPASTERQMFAFGQEIAIPPLTEERAAVLRFIMENVTHDSMPNPHVMNIVLEETAPFLAGNRSAEDAARIIQNRVQTYLSEQMR